MGLSIVAGIGDLFCEAAQTDFSSKSLLMLGKQNIGHGKAELYVTSKRLGAKLNYRKLYTNVPGGG